jgi:hypothetical protein
MEDTGRLDVAVCETSSRPGFLATTIGPGVVYAAQNSEDTCYGTHIWKWYVARGVFMDGIVAVSELTNDTELFQKFLSCAATASSFKIVESLHLNDSSLVLQTS